MARHSRRLQHDSQKGPKTEGSRNKQESAVTKEKSMTVKEIIEIALQDVGVLPEGAEASPEAITDGLKYLNSMLGSWSSDSLIIPVITRSSFVLPQKQEVGVGIGLDLNIYPPTQITGVTIHYAGVAYVSRQVPEESVRAIAQPSTDTIPSSFSYLPGIDTASILFSSIAPPACSISLRYLRVLEEYESLIEETEFPPGYDFAMHKGLAVVMAAKFGKQASPETAVLAADAYAKIKRRNAINRGSLDADLPKGMPGIRPSARYNIHLQ